MKRGNGEGTITQDKRDGRWHGQLTMPDGHRKNVYGKTRREVQTKLAQLRREIDAGLHTHTAIAGRNTSFVTYCEQWFALHRHGIAESTQQRYKNILTIHIPRYFSDMKLGDITPAHVNAACREILNADYAIGTVKIFRNVLHLVFGAAEREELILRNPVAKTQLPKKQTDSAEIVRVFSRDEMYQLIDIAQGTLLETIIPFGFFTGMRRNEILGARWRDINWQKCQIHVQHQIQMRNGIPCYVKLKTKTSNRIIPLPPSAIDILRTQQHHIEQVRAIAGEAWDATYDCIFPDAFGYPIKEFQFHYGFKILVQKIGLPFHTIHCMRHTYATLLLEMGVSPKTTAALLGHTDPTITLQTYAHLLPDSVQNAAETLQNMFLIDGQISEEK